MGEAQPNRAPDSMLAEGLWPGAGAPPLLEPSLIDDGRGSPGSAPLIARGRVDRPPAAESAWEAAARLRAVVETAVDGIITIDEHGIIETVNPATVKLFGYEPHELIGQNVRLLMPEPYQDEHDRYIGDYLRTGQRRIIGLGREVEGRRKDGSIFPMELAVSETQLCDRRIFTGIVRDVTDRKRAEERLQSAVEKRTAELAAANQQLRLEIDRRTRVEAILAGEKRVLELIATGAPVDQALEAICETVAGHAAGVRCAIQVAVEDTPPPAGTRTFGHASLFGLPAGFPADRGQRCVVDNAAAEPALEAWAKRWDVRALSTEPVVGTTGQAFGTVVIAYSDLRSPTAHEVDAGAGAARLAGIIMEKARADERARRQLAELAHVARLATMGEMASGLAHELNQPLCAIVNYTEACLELLDTKSDNGELRAAMVEVAKQSERAGEVIRRLREFVRHREPQRVAVDVNQAVREVLGLTSAELRQQEIRVKLQLGQRLPPVAADAIQIQQVLVNLVRNAIDAMAETECARRRLRIKTCRRGGFIEVAVEDSGRGISAETRAHVFESFFTTKTHGMGMGLSISRSIVEMHEGRIWVTPNPARGVTFHFTLPPVRRTRNDSAGSNRLHRG